jgi:hypothetical protein
MLYAVAARQVDQQINPAHVVFLVSRHTQQQQQQQQQASLPFSSNLS